MCIRDRYPVIESLSIDTWAVDYVLLKDGPSLYTVYAYREDRTQAVIPAVHSLLPFAQLSPVSYTHLL